MLSNASSLAQKSDRMSKSPRDDFAFVGKLDT
jgi:hypothetical protein